MDKKYTIAVVGMGYVILANRIDAELMEVSGKVYTRDLFGRD